MSGVVGYIAEAFFSETPVIFEDTNPDQQDSYLGSYITSLKGSLYTAATGIVPKFHEPGKIRVVFWTTENSQGDKEFELIQYEEAYEFFNKCRLLGDVRRACIMGYKGQNPYAATTKSRLLTEMLDREIEKTRKERERVGGVKPMKEEVLNIEDLVEGLDGVEKARKEKEASKREKVEV